MRLGDLDYAQKQLTIAEVECGKNFQTDCNHVRDFLNALPTIDAVPVVRCSECIHYETCESGKDFCCFHAIGIVPDDFCSYGERKEAEGNG